MTSALEWNKAVVAVAKLKKIRWKKPRNMRSSPAQAKWSVGIQAFQEFDHAALEGEHFTAGGEDVVGGGLGCSLEGVFPGVLGVSDLDIDVYKQAGDVQGLVF
ncbi:MAG: hypothetical protein Q9166_005912 [cf. Caloplaca sp. 2 TL-2023]